MKNAISMAEYLLDPPPLTARSSIEGYFSLAPTVENEYIEPDFTVESALYGDSIHLYDDDDVIVSDQAMVRIYSPSGPSPTATVVRPAAGSYNGLNGGAATPFSPASSAATKEWGQQRRVIVVKPTPDAPLGVSIVGGTTDAGEAGVFVKNVLPDGLVGRTGKIFTGDRVLEVAGVRLTSADHGAAVRAIREAAGSEIEFVVQSLDTSGGRLRPASLAVRAPSGLASPSAVSTSAASFSPRSAGSLSPVRSDAGSEAPSRGEPEIIQVKAPTATM